MSLTPKQQRFVSEYLIDLNATQAAIRAGYSEKTAKAIAKSFAHFALHFPIPEWNGLISGLAFPFTPSEIDKGPVYRFTLNHVVVPDDATEMFRTEWLEV